MTFSLLHLDSGHLSLEFAPDDHAALNAAALAMFGPVGCRLFVIAAELSIGGQTFTYQDEWDDPCIIASTKRGDEILRALFDRLKTS